MEGVLDTLYIVNELLYISLQLMMVLHFYIEFVASHFAN